MTTKAEWIGALMGLVLATTVACFLAPYVPKGLHWFVGYGLGMVFTGIGLLIGKHYGK